MKTKHLTSIDQQETLSVAIKGCLHSLKEHWVYDAVQLLNDCAIALERIREFVTKLEEHPEWFEGRESEAMKEIAAIASFIKEWESVSQKCVTEALLCPDVIESNLEALMKSVNIPATEKKRMLRRWSAEDLELEPPIVTIARKYWDI
jgi:hypothetical protein